MRFRTELGTILQIAQKAASRALSPLARHSILLQFLMLILAQRRGGSLALAPCASGTHPRALILSSSPPRYATISPSEGNSPKSIGRIAA